MASRISLPLFAGGAIGSEQVAAASFTRGSSGVGSAHRGSGCTDCSDCSGVGSSDTASVTTDSSSCPASSDFATSRVSADISTLLGSSEAELLGAHALPLSSFF